MTIEEYVKSKEHIRKVIEVYRTQLLLYRIYYYCYDTSIIPDVQYDLREHSLKTLVKKHPEIAAKAKYHECCPVVYPGSSILEKYPVELQEIAKKRTVVEAADVTNR